MTTMTLAVDNELKKKMNEHPEMNWSEVARQAFRQRVADMELFEKIKGHSKLTKQDALRLGKKVSKAMSDRLRELAKNAPRH